MKVRKISSKKLDFKKSTISNLNLNQMNGVQGGASGYTICTQCQTNCAYTLCLSNCVSVCETMCTTEECA